MDMRLGSCLKTSTYQYRHNDMKTFIKTQLLGPMIAAAILTFAGALARQLQPALLVHLLGGLADGDTVYVQCEINDRVLSSEGDISGGPNELRLRQLRLESSTDAGQRWKLKLTHR